MYSEKEKQYNWNDKAQRAEKAVLHTEEMRRLYSKEIENAITNTKIYDGRNMPTPMIAGNIPEIEVTTEDSVTAVLRNKDNGKVAVLNFASFKNPGGMFIKGSKAQEECLCHESILYNVIGDEKLSGFYKTNQNYLNKSLYRNRALYSENVLFLRDEEKAYCDVITCASPNKTAAMKYKNVEESENSLFLTSRIRFLLDVAEINHVDTLILGAFGCGVFGQNPYEVASLFKGYIIAMQRYSFKKVIFAIPGGLNENAAAFKKVFG